jgi:RHS repeat-associated protein
VLSYEPTFGGVQSTELYVPEGSKKVRYSTAQTFDHLGRVDTVTYPETGTIKRRFTIRNVYGGANGMLSEVRDITSGVNNRLWQANEREPLGRIQKETLANNVVSTRGYLPLTGRLSSITTGTAAAPQSIQALSYKYYADGNVFIRNDGKSGLRERFEYDDLGRLHGWMKAQGSDLADSQGWSVAWDYDDRGNLIKRTASAAAVANQTINQQYNGGASAPHRLDSSDLWPSKTFAYDPLGSIKSHPGVGTIDYTPFHLPRKVTGTSTTVDYLYDAFGGRVRKGVGGTGGNSTTYVGDLYERRTDGSETVHVLYVHAEGRVVSQITRSEPSGSERTSYVYSDHLGSTQVVQGPDGALTERRQDPFGNNVSWNGTILDPRISASAPGGAGSEAVTRGFTGKEEEGDLGVVNMGGRIYDPRLGRFLQADPVVTPGSSQGWNRYSYAMNNPLRFTDPTGFVTADQARESELTLDDFCLIHPNTCTDEQFQSPESMVAEFGEYNMGQRLGEPDKTPNNEKIALDKWLNVNSGAQGGSLQAAAAEISRVGPVDPKELGKYLAGRPADFRSRVSYDPKLKDYGVTSPAGRVRLGPAAFSSPAQLRSTLDHEATHFGDLRGGNFARSGALAAQSVGEVHAYRSELANARSNGLTPSEVRGINRELQRELFYLQQVDPQYYQRTQRGDYRLREEDVCPTSTCGAR